MAENGITLDNDVEEMNGFRYNTLVNLFGKEKADEMLIPKDDDEFFDDDVQEILDEVEGDN